MATRWHRTQSFDATFGVTGRDRPRGIVSLAAPRTFAELLIGCQEDRTLRAVLVGMLREAGPNVALD